MSDLSFPPGHIFTIKLGAAQDTPYGHMAMIEIEDQWDLFECAIPCRRAEGMSQSRFEESAMWLALLRLAAEGYSGAEYITPDCQKPNSDKVPSQQGVLDRMEASAFENDPVVILRGNIGIVQQSQNSEGKIR